MLLAGCGGKPGSSRPRGGDAKAAHLRAADRVCRAAQPDSDRAGDRIVNANDAWVQSGEPAEAARAEAGWVELSEILRHTFTRLRAVNERGADPRYDAFVSAWGQTIAPVTDMVSYATSEDLEIVEANLDVLADVAAQLQTAARKVGLARCEAPLERGGKAKAG